MESQSWDYVVLKGKPKAASGPSDKKAENVLRRAMQSGESVESISKSKKNTNAPAPSNIRKLIEADDEYVAETVSFEFRQALQRARQEKNLTQEKLAQMCNVKQTVVQDYESGRAVPNPIIINALERALNTRLPRGKKK
eukprot:TRINITY_DN0_c875_g1_i2.p1 TRINITY_DN0_c875_g1~~TRINITY_DN0_c875_g1_i2.p1  ORF type:complete len:139 (+),score=49.22 TRINITY_DN0_c875_g1_i2:53-469(+)